MLPSRVLFFVNYDKEEPDNDVNRIDNDFRAIKVRTGHYFLFFHVKHEVALPCTLKKNHLMGVYQLEPRGGVPAEAEILNLPSPSSAWWEPKAMKGSRFFSLGRISLCMFHVLTEHLPI